MATEKAIPLFADPVARETANNAMPKSGGTFTGTVIPVMEDTTENCLRTNVVLDKSYNNVSTSALIFIRK